MEVEEDLDIHYYVLYCQSLKIEKLYYVFNNQKDVEAFIPRYEKYIRSKDKVIINPMFPGYLFIKTSKDQIEFDTMLTLMYEQKDGVIKELKKKMRYLHLQKMKYISYIYYLINTIY